MLIIKSADNGFIVTAKNEGEADVIHAFEEPFDCPLDPDPDTVARMLWRVVEYFGATGSKHDARRISITVEARDDGAEAEP
jgi:hypothetical protein